MTTAIPGSAQKAARQMLRVGARLAAATSRATWIFATTMLVLVIPVIIEMDREQQMTVSGPNQAGRSKSGVGISLSHTRAQTNKHKVDATAGFLLVVVVVVFLATALKECARVPAQTHTCSAILFNESREISDFTAFSALQSVLE